MKAATGVWRWQGGQGITGVSEIEETPRITPVIGAGESNLGSRRSLAIGRVPARYALRYAL
jgi:hypothetical protein